MPPRRIPSAPVSGGVAKAEKEEPIDGPHVLAVVEQFKSIRQKQGGNLTSSQREDMAKKLKRARYADRHGSYVAGDAAQSADEARVEERRNLLRECELNFQCGLSKSSQAAKEWTARDPRLDHRAAPPRHNTPKASTPLSRTSSSSRTPPGEDRPRQDLLAMLMAASSPDASPMAGVAATPRVLVDIDPLDFDFDTPSGSDETPSA